MNHSFSLLAILTLCGGASTAQEASDLELERFALGILKKDYQLEYHEKDQDGYVTHVRLQGKRFDDKAVDQALHFKKLTGISMARSSITDASMKKLPQLKQLTKIWIGYTAITDRGLGDLENIPTLLHIWVPEANNVTGEGLDSLRRAVPDLTVHFGPQKNLAPFKNDPLYKNGLIDKESKGGVATLLIVGLVITLSLALGLCFWLRKKSSLMATSEATPMPNQESESERNSSAAKVNKT